MFSIRFHFRLAATWTKFEMVDMVRTSAIPIGGDHTENGNGHVNCRDHVLGAFENGTFHINLEMNSYFSMHKMCIIFIFDLQVEQM